MEGKKREEEGLWGGVFQCPLPSVNPDDRGSSAGGGRKEGDPIARRRKFVLIQVCLGDRFNEKSLVCGTKRDPAIDEMGGEGRVKG